MKTTMMRTTLISAATVLMTGASAHGVSLLANGSFEAGLTSWSTADQLGSDGSFLVQSGTTSPLNAFDVAAPAHGLSAAMTDAGAGGSHVLYQDFTIPADVTSGTVSFKLFLRNHAETYYNPAHLDWAQTNPSGPQNLNQQARVDIVTTGADLFSTAPADVLLNLFRTDAATPAVTGYNTFSFDLTALLVARAGQTLRLRFAQVDNVNVFNFGVDDVAVNAIPAPATAMLAAGTLAFAGRRRRVG